MNIRIIFLTVTLVLYCSTPLSAQERQDHASPVRVLKAALDLTTEQVTGLRELINARAEAVGESNEQINELQALLEEELRSEAPDALEVGEIVLETRMFRQEIGQYHEEFQSSFRAILTPEQLERIRQINRIALANRAAEVLSQLRLR